MLERQKMTRRRRVEAHRLVLGEYYYSKTICRQLSTIIKQINNTILIVMLIQSLTINLRFLFENKFVLNLRQDEIFICQVLLKICTFT